MFVGSRFLTQGRDRGVGLFDGCVVGVSKRRQIALLLDVFICAGHDTFHVRVCEDFDVVVLVLDGVRVRGVVVLLHNAIEGAVSRKVFSNSLS